jgi:toxin ParE1/3/4
MKNIVWLKSAKLDLIEINAYFAENASTQVAAELMQRIYASANHLVEQPYLGVQTMDDDILEWHIPTLRYTLPYMVNGDDIEILRVFHQSQKKPSKWEE